MKNSLNYDLFLSTYLSGRKFSQLNMFKNLDIIDTQFTNSVYMNYTILHRQEFLDYFEKESRFLVEELPFYKKKFIEVYDEFMENYKQKDKRSRYAVQLKLLYPKSLDTTAKQIKFIREFVNQLVEVKQVDEVEDGKNKISKLDLPYVVENVNYARVNYAVVTILERKYLGQSNYKRYKTTKCIDTRTGRFASRECEDEFKKISCKCGDYQKDRNGDFIKCKEYFSKNMRIFAYAKDLATGRNLFVEFMEKLKTKFLNALKKVVVTGVKKGRILYKRQNKENYCNVVRRRIGMINYAKETIQYTINFLLQHEMSHDQVFESYIEGRDNVIQHTVTYHKLINIFEKYRARFKKEEFHDNDGNLRHIQHVYQRIDELEENIRILVKMFFLEINLVSLS